MGAEKEVLVPATTTRLSIEQGADFSHGWRVTVDGELIDSTWSGRGQIRAKVLDGNVLHTLDVECTDTGDVVVTVPAHVSTAWGQTWKIGVYDVEISNSDASVNLRVAKGSVAVSWEVTR